MFTNQTFSRGFVLLAFVAGCATVREQASHPPPANRGEQLLWELDEGNPTIELNDGMVGVLSSGLKIPGSDMRRDYGRLLSVTSVHDESPTWESDELSAIL